MVGTTELRDGMKVRTSDGQDLGKIIRLDSGILVIEKGFFFPKDYEVPVSLVSHVSDDEAHLSISKEALEREGGDDAGWSERTRQRPGEGAGLGGSATEETRVRLAEEELEASKRVREAGEVRVRKDVVTEHRSVDVPVTREEVHVERVPVSARDEEVGRDAFEEKTISVPVREEEVEITKRPRVKEEVRVAKTAHTTEQRADAEVRREEARVDRTDEGRGSAGGTGEDEASRSAYRDAGRDERGGGILGLGKDDER